MQVLSCYSDVTLQAPPPKTTSWSESAHSSSTKYPVAIQAKLPLDRARPSPRTNKRRRPEEEDEEDNSLNRQATEENLCSMYSVSQPSETTVTSNASLTSQDKPVTSR